MSIIIEANDMDGKSIHVGSLADLAEVPADHRKLVSREERAALTDSSGYFHDLARRAKSLLLRRWLKMLADCKSRILELHTSSLPGFEPDVFFRFFLDNDSSPGVRLRSAKTIPALPPPLAEVYELIDGINHHGFGMAGELMSAADIAPFPRTEIWLSETNTADPETCMLFYSSLNGDMLGFQLPDRAMWYVHEVGELRPAGSLHSLVERYFQELIQGGVLERE
jgi:hypothetical protein